MTSGDMEDIDPGLARERTEFAWARTAVSFAALAGVLFKFAPAAGSLILGMSSVVYLLGRVTRPSDREGEQERRHALRLITVAVTTVSLAALTTVFFATDGPFPLR